MDNVDIVVALYKENLDWISPFQSSCIVYDKGNNVPLSGVKKWSSLPNIGRESHTYLTHIVENYNTLSDITIFTQGSIHDHIPLDPKKVFEKCVENSRIQGFANFDNNAFCNCTSWNRINHIDKWLFEITNGFIKHAELTFGEFWDKIFVNRVRPKTNLRHTHCGIFGVTRKRIHKYPKSFYQNILTMLGNHSNPEEGHYVERLWLYIFTTSD